MGLEDSEELHRYTRGRFVANEITEMKLRYAHFDLNHLASIAAHAVGSTTCVKVEKLAEGEFNKALFLKMDDGKEAVARVPNPNAGQEYFTTASEVATMNYVSVFVCSEYVPSLTSVRRETFCSIRSQESMRTTAMPREVQSVLNLS